MSKLSYKIIILFLLIIGFGSFVSAQTISGTPKWQWITGNYIEPIKSGSDYAVPSSTEYCLGGSCITEWSSGGVSYFSSLSDVNLTSTSTGDTIYFDGSDWVNLGIGTAGQVLKVSAGLPSWGTDLQGAGGSGVWATTTDSLAIYPSDTSYTVLVGNNATTTLGNILEVTGNSYFNGNATTTGQHYVGWLKLPTTTAPTYAPGLLFYEEYGSNSGLSFYNSEPDTILNIGKELWKDVRNCNTGDTILDGTAVYLTGTVVNQRPCIEPASADTELKATVVGVTTHDIENNTDGVITKYGVLNEIDTSGLTDGYILYLATSTDGSLNDYRNMTITKPVAPYYSVRIGEVDYSHTTLGKIEVDPSFPHDLNDNQDVKTSSNADNDLFAWDNTQGFWKNVSSIVVNAITATTGNFTNIEVSSVATTTKLCFTNGECMTEPSPIGAQVTFYPHNTNSDVATYEDMFTYPDGATPIDESCSAISSTDEGYCLIDTYISTSTDISITNYPAGNTKIFVNSYVSSAAGDSRVVLKGYKRDILGTETLLGTATTTEINNLTVEEVVTTFTGSEDFPFNSDGTDRLVMKVYGWTDSSAARDIHWTYKNTGNYSHMETPITLSDTTYAKSNRDETITGTWTFSSLPILSTLTGWLRADSGIITASTSPYFSTLNIGSATSTSFYTSLLGLNSEYFSDLTGTNLENSSGVLSVIDSPVFSGDLTVTGYGQFNNVTTTDSLYVGGNADIVGNLTVTGNVTGANLNITNWDTAYGWGDHSLSGYLTDLNDQTLGSIGDISTSSLSYGSMLVWDTSNWMSSTTLPFFDVLWDNKYIATSTKSGDFTFSDNLNITGNATTTGNFVIGADDTGKKGCMGIQDIDLGGWTYCYTINGTMTCGTTDCSDTGSNATSTILIGQ